MNNQSIRKTEENIAKILMIISISIVLLSLLGIILIIFVKGLPALNFSMLFETPKEGYYLGGSGGIANAIVGSFYLSLGGIIISLFFALPLAFALQKDYLPKKITAFTRFILDVLCGVPSIVYGVFVFLIMKFFTIRASLLGGIITLAILMLPLMTRSMEEVIRLVPAELREASYSLGATRFETTFKVLFKQALPGILIAILVAFGRGIGDAASILFTAGYTDSIPTSLLDPVASLPLAVFFQLSTPVPEVQQRAYAAAIILLGIILIVTFTSRYLNNKFAKYTIH